MTVFLRDCSDFDSNESLVGFDGGTNKYSEGTTVTHTSYGPRLNRWRAGGAKVLGSYHVLRTPGSGGNGSLSSQLDFWLSGIDRLTPWWRSVPFILQIDLERWPYDAVTLGHSVLYPEARHVLDRAQFEDVRAARASTGVQFAQLLVNAGVPGWKICYASRGQYGDTLAGLPVPLWNAAYHSGTYPGDGAADWNAYSGQTPKLWQYTSTPFDKSAYRGTVAQLIAEIKGADMAFLDDKDAAIMAWRVEALINNRDKVAGGPTAGEVNQARAALGDLQSKMAALATSGTSLDTAAVVSAVLELQQQVATLAAHISKAAQDLA